MTGDPEHAGQATKDAPADSAPPPPGYPPTGPAHVGPPRPLPPLFGDRWTRPEAPPSRVVLGAVAVAGSAAAVLIPDDRPGLGWFAAVLVITAAALVVRWHTRRSLPPLPALLAEIGWTLAAVGLAAVSAVRDADWLVVLSVLAACGAGSLAVAGRSFRGVVFSAVAVPVAALRAVPWLGRPVRDARQGAGGRGVRVAVALLVGVALLAVFGALLTSADAAFARVIDDLLPAVDDASVPRWVVLFGLGAWGMLGACFLLVAPPVPAEPRPVGPPRVRTLEWALPVGLLVGLFALFVGVQFAALFGSDDYVVRTTGLTYAEYARGGFWQLLLVTVLALGVIVLGSRLAPGGTRAERAVKRGLLGALACLTLVIVASALSRMWLYQQAYGFTVLRLLVLTCELWLGAGFLLVLGSVLRLRPARPARGMAVAGTVALLALTVLDPERFVADHNVTRFTETGQIDVDYLASLSADAVPALMRLPDPQRSCALTGITDRLATPDGDWRSANTARAAARMALDGPQPTCPAPLAR